LILTAANNMKSCFATPIICLLIVWNAVHTQAQQLNILHQPAPRSFPLAASKLSPVTLYTDTADAAVVQIATTAFQHDLQLVTGKLPELAHATRLPATGSPVIIGTIGHSALIDSLVQAGMLPAQEIRGQWEAFSITVLTRTIRHTQQKVLVIAGSDRRGTAFGVFELSRRMGVSPWCWWADVHPAPQKELYVTGSFRSGTPSVQYRGIFLNDEDWGLQPWAAAKMDTTLHDIGPNTYTRIFELLLRLKANYLWPAMHPCTKAFYYYAANPVLADKYAIVIGSSHCEPMLRNNVFEWNENFQHEYGKKPGEWRYDLNKEEIYRYWKDRVQQSRQYESVYTVGMRGIHDGSMPGPKDMTAKLRLLDTIIADQRNLLQTVTGQPAATLPQIFCPYKEVLTLYQKGIQLPDDVAIVWADDNHGYIRQLSTPKEQQRKGGSGVYYHLSYWGAPQDYLWLSSISPSLISFELTKAWQYNARQYWVINVGDIKPAEMELQFTMDLAWDINSWPPEKAYTYATQWASDIFGPAAGQTIGQIKQTYYQLAQPGKPEHLGVASFTAVQWEKRLAAYEQISSQAAALQSQIPARLQDAYFELVYYPVQCTRYMNEKIGRTRKNELLSAAGQQPDLADEHKVRQAYEAIQSLTQQYNQRIANGKWNGMMSAHPRNQPVFKMPGTTPLPATDTALKTPLLVIPAASFLRKQENKDNTIQTMPGLGNSNKGITCLPVTALPVATGQWAQASFVEWTVTLPAGQRTILVNALPTHRQHAGRGVRYAISVNNDAPQVVELETPTDNATWKTNVLRGAAQGNTQHQVTLPKTTIRIYFIDPGVVLDELQIF
jgi:hypothetical protein